MISTSTQTDFAWHATSPEDALARFRSSADGLVSEEAQRRLDADGPNELPHKKADHWGEVFTRQFANPLILVLVVACVLSAVLQEWVDAGVIAAAVVFNTVVGFIQEYKANASLERLRSLTLPRALVRRGSREQEIDVREIVVGDVLVLHLGDRVSADARLLETVEMMVDESTLTGESAAVLKGVEPLPIDTILAERHNLVFAGTSVVGGRGLALALATGARTQLGMIATLVEQTREGATPLQAQLARLARGLAIIVLVLVAGLFVSGVVLGRSNVEMFSMAVALSVAAIPEGLAVSVTIILAIGMQRILKRKSLVRTLVGAETLGSVSIICTDKTGTITQGEMRVTHFSTLDATYGLAQLQTPRPPCVEEMLRVMALCNDAVLDGEQARGSQTERALLLALAQLGVDSEALVAALPRTGEIPFDSARKYMATAHASDVGTLVMLKGAWSHIAPFVSQVSVAGSVVAMTPEIRHRIDEQERELARKGLRLIAVAHRTQDTSPLPPPLAPRQPPLAPPPPGRTSVRTGWEEGGSLREESLCDFVFLGFVGLRDPLRPEVAQQIEDARAAGVRTIMLTGDHPDTARVIGEEAGLVEGTQGVVTGRELDAWSDEELAQRISQITIFARVEPRHKIRIVSAWQARGEVVAMTGDGVNDAPALKAADIGIALGSGTDVAKQASDLVVLDNNLGIITAAIEEGRVIFDNIRKTTVYLLAGSFTEIVLIGGSILMGLPLPLLPLQILWINLVTDSFPNVGLTLEPGERDVMKLPPRPRKESVLNREMLMIVFIIGVVTDLVLFALYLWLLSTGENIDTIRSIMFAAVGIDSLLYVFAVKSFRRTIFRINPFSNPWLVLGVGLGLCLMLVALLTPFFQEAFEIVPLSLPDWGLLIMMGLVKLFAIELAKEFFLMRRSRSTFSTSAT